MRRRASLLLLVLLNVLVSAAVTIRNITEWRVLARAPPVTKVLGWDRGNPVYGVKRATAWWAVEAGLNVTYVEVMVPRCHRAVFDPVLNLTVGETVTARLEAVSLTGPYTSQLSLNISLAGVRQVSVRSGSIIQASGSPVSITRVASFRLEVLVGSGAPLGVEVAWLETWLRYNVSTVRVSQRIVWIFRTFPAPPRVVLFYDGFESGSLVGWERTNYTYVERKLYDVTVTETCFASSQRPTPSSITDVTRPVAGEWLAWIGFRNQVTCEPGPENRDYLRRSISVPTLIDGVEVRFVNVTFWWRFLTWDSASYDYINLRLGVGTTNYFFKQNYNPNPGTNYGPFRDTGWQRNSTIFSGLAGRTATIEFFLRTYSDALYRSWLYVDEVYFVAHFDCVSAPVALALVAASSPQAHLTPLGLEEASADLRDSKRALCCGVNEGQIGGSDNE